MKVLITGASGFIGRNLLLALPPQWEMLAVYNLSTDFPAFLKSHQLDQINSLQADLGVEEEVEKIGRVSSDFDSCVFLAANGDPAVSIARPAYDLVSNTLTLINLVKRVRFRQFIYFSSGAVYDGIKGPVDPTRDIHPNLPYAISKMTSERYLLHFQKQGQIENVVNVRFFGAYGPYEPARKIYTRLVRQFGVARNPRFTIRGDGRNLIDAMYIEDAVLAIQSLLDHPGCSLTLDLYSGQPLTLRRLVESAARAFGFEAEITCEGEVPEYIEFFSVDQTIKNTFVFWPSVKLSDGLMRLHRHLTCQS